MNISPIGSAPDKGPLPLQQTAAEDRKPLADTEIQRLTEDIEKEESELKQINRELAKYLADGAQDMAKLKTVEITQKQMQLQAMRLQISRLEKPKEAGEAADPAANGSAYAGRAKFDQYVKSDGEPEETPGLYHVEKDENGNQTVVFDRPLPDPAAPGEQDNRPEPEDGSEKKVSVGKSVADDSRWRAEIDNIKQKQSQLSRELSGARDNEDRRRELEAQLARIEAELAAKNTDAYRKQRTVVRYLGSQSVDADAAAELS